MLRWTDLVAVLVLSTVLAAQPPAVEATGTKKINYRNTEKAAAAGRLMSKALEQRVDLAVDRGLAWLAEQQNDKGFWTGLIGHKSSVHYRPLRSIEEQRRHGTGHLGVTALCGMAYLAGGHLPRRGKYGGNVQKAVDAVISCVQEDGCRL